MEDYKQIIIIRKDLKMRQGKAVAQGAHASMGAILDQGYALPGSASANFIIPLTPTLQAWLTGKFKKICVYVNSEQELLDLCEQAKTASLIHKLILDSGLTEFGGIPTYTALAIGPDLATNLDPLTKHLPLL